MSGPADAVPVHELNIRKPYFDLIVSGVKTVEVRVGYTKIRRIKPGDQLRFRSGDEEQLTRVRRVTEYPSFTEMLSHEDPIAIGGELGESKNELLAVIRSIYPPEKEELGAFAIEVARSSEPGD